MAQCSYCFSNVPSWNFRTTKHRGETLMFCADGSDSCYNKWNRLRIAQRLAIEILRVTKNCKFGVHKKDIENAFRISKMREIVLNMVEQIKNSARRILRKSVQSVKKLLYRLKKLTDVVGLENQYQQLKALFKTT